MAKATGIGGVFFRSEDPERTIKWYQEHLGIEPEADHPSATMKWSGGETTIWAPFESDTEYFGSSEQLYMVNYRVDDLVKLLGQLRAAGVEVIDEEEHGDFGDFGWAIDCDGRRIELWQSPAGS